MTIILLLLTAYLFSVFFVQLRGKKHFKLSKQFGDFSTFMVLFNIPAFLLSKVPTTPRIDKKHFPEINIIEENWEIIRDEAMQLYNLGHIAAKDDLPASSFYKDDRWKSFYLKLYNHKLPSAYECAPKTMELLNQVPSLNLALFALLMPGKKLSDHHDPFAYTVRYSLGLVTPNSEKCGLDIDGDKYIWKDGDSIIFDETYCHNAYNDSDQIRLILMTDIDRPLKSKIIQKCYYYFGKTFNGLFAQDNLDASHTGIGNKFGKGLQAFKTQAKKFKRANKSAYVAVKYSLIFSLLALAGYALI